MPSTSTSSVRDGRRRRERVDLPPSEQGPWIRGYFTFQISATGRSLETAERILRRCGGRVARRGHLGHDYTRAWSPPEPDPRPIGRRRRGSYHAPHATSLQHYEVWATRAGWDQIRVSFGEAALRRNGWKVQSVELSAECEERCRERQIDPDLVLRVASGGRKDVVRRGSELSVRQADGSRLVVRMQDEITVATAFVNEGRVGRGGAE